MRWDICIGASCAVSANSLRLEARMEGCMGQIVGEDGIHSPYVGYLLPPANCLSLSIHHLSFSHLISLKMAALINIPANIHPRCAITPPEEQYRR